MWRRILIEPGWSATLRVPGASVEHCEECVWLERARFERLAEYKTALNRQTTHLQKRIAAAYYRPDETDREIAAEVRQSADVFMSADVALSDHLESHRR
jgi:hypothetical protein